MHREGPRVRCDYLVIAAIMFPHAPAFTYCVRACVRARAGVRNTPLCYLIDVIRNTFLRSYLGTKTMGETWPGLLIAWRNHLRVVERTEQALRKGEQAASALDLSSSLFTLNLCIMTCVRHDGRAQARTCLTSLRGSRKGGKS